MSPSSCGTEDVVRRRGTAEIPRAPAWDSALRGPDLGGELKWLDSVPEPQCSLAVSWLLGGRDLELPTRVRPLSQATPARPRVVRTDGALASVAGGATGTPISAISAGWVASPLRLLGGSKWARAKFTGPGKGPCGAEPRCPPRSALRSARWCGRRWFPPGRMKPLAKAVERDNVAMDLLEHVEGPRDCFIVVGVGKDRHGPTIVASRGRPGSEVCAPCWRQCQGVPTGEVLLHPPRCRTASSRRHCCGGFVDVVSPGLWLHLGWPRFWKSQLSSALVKQVIGDAHGECRSRCSFRR